MTPPQLHDGEGWPFRFLARVPYQPTDFEDWRADILKALAAADLVHVHDWGHSK